MNRENLTDDHQKIIISFPFSSFQTNVRMRHNSHIFEPESLGEAAGNMTSAAAEDVASAQRRARRFTSSRSRSAVIVQGFPGSGKTTLLNALAGDRLFPYLLDMNRDAKPSVAWMNLPPKHAATADGFSSGRSGLVADASYWKSTQQPRVAPFPLSRTASSLFRSWSDSSAIGEDAQPPKPHVIASVIPAQIVAAESDEQDIAATKKPVEASAPPASVDAREGEEEEYLDDFDFIESSSWDTASAASTACHSVEALPLSAPSAGTQNIAAADVVDTVEALLKLRKQNPAVRDAHFLVMRAVNESSRQPSVEAQAGGLQKEASLAQDDRDGHSDESRMTFVESQQLEDRPAMHLINTCIYVINGEDANVFKHAASANAPCGSDDNTERRTSLLAALRAATTVDDSATECFIVVNVRRRQLSSEVPSAVANDDELSDFDLLEDDDAVEKRRQQVEELNELLPLSELQESVARRWRVRPNNVFVFDFQKCLAASILAGKFAAVDHGDNSREGPLVSSSSADQQEFARLCAAIAHQHRLAGERYRARQDALQLAREHRRAAEAQKKPSQAIPGSRAEPYVPKCSQQVEVVPPVRYVPKVIEQAAAEDDLLRQATAKDRRDEANVAQRMERNQAEAMASSREVSQEQTEAAARCLERVNKKTTSPPPYVPKVLRSPE